MTTNPLPHAKKPIYKDMVFQVFVAILLGILVGIMFPSSPGAPGFAEKMKPLGEAFINLIKMMIAPIIFCTIVTGIAGIGNMKSAGRVGLKAIIYFEVITTFALIMGLVMVHVLQPGVGMNIDPASLDSAAVEAKLSGKKLESTADFLMHIIPKSLVGSFADNEILPVLLISILFASALTALGSRGKPVVNFVADVSHVLFGMIGIITKIAPLGAFGAIAYTVGAYGVRSLQSQAEMLLDFYLVCIIFVVVVLGAVMKFCRLSIFRFLAYIKEELIIVLGTSSSETVLPRLIDKMTNLGCNKTVVGLVIPTGYSFNLDGTSIYLTMAAVFIAQALNIDLTFQQEMLLLGVLLLTSKGAAGVAGSGFVVLAGTLESIHTLPVAGIALILGVDAFMSRGRALTNLIGNGVATVFVSKWEREFDEMRARDILSGRKVPRLETDVTE